MKNQSASVSILGLLLLSLFLSSTTLTQAQEVEDESEFEYRIGSQKGPSRWGDLKKEWEDCKKGKMQSPIDLSHERVKLLINTEKRHYRPSTATIMNRGHDIMVKWVGNNAGSILINGTEYFLQQAHWHTPSEHTVNGRRYDMELHMVHQHTDENGKNNIAVHGVFFKIGKPNAFLSKLLRNTSFLEEHNHKEGPPQVIDPREIRMASKRYYRYMGSLTTPPCTENVIWTIYRKVRTVSKDQIKRIRQVVHDNAEINVRPLQAHNSREIYLYGPETSA